MEREGEEDLDKDERSCHGCRQESDATRRHKVTR